MNSSKNFERELVGGRYRVVIINGLGMLVFIVSCSNVEYLFVFIMCGRRRLEQISATPPPLASRED